MLWSCRAIGKFRTEFQDAFGSTPMYMYIPFQDIHVCLALKSCLTRLVSGPFLTRQYLNPFLFYPRIAGPSRGRFVVLLSTVLLFSVHLNKSPYRLACTRKHDQIKCSILSIPILLGSSSREQYGKR